MAASRNQEPNAYESAPSHLRLSPRREEAGQERADEGRLLRADAFLTGAAAARSSGRAVRRSSVAAPATVAAWEPARGRRRSEDAVRGTPPQPRGEQPVQPAPDTRTADRKGSCGSRGFSCGAKTQLRCGFCGSPAVYQSGPETANLIDKTGYNSLAAFGRQGEVLFTQVSL
jgi:hypothetical protein